MKRKFKVRTAFGYERAERTIEEELKNGYEPISIGGSNSFFGGFTIYLLFKLIE